MASRNTVSMSSGSSNSNGILRGNVFQVGSDSSRSFVMEGRLGGTGTTGGAGVTTRSQSRKLTLSESGPSTSTTTTAAKPFLKRRSPDIHPAVGFGLFQRTGSSNFQASQRSQSVKISSKKTEVIDGHQPGPSSLFKKSNKGTDNLKSKLDSDVLSKKQVKCESAATVGKENIEEMEEMEVDEVDPNALIFYEAKGNCGYCGVVLNEMEGVILQSCFHIFCRDCLVSSIELQDTVEIFCPQGCGESLLEKEIKALCTREVFRKWEERGMKAAKAALGGCAAECYWPGCNGWVEMDDIESRRIFVCPSCGKQNCLKCKAVHDGVSCEEYDQLKAKAAATGESVIKLLEMQEGRDWGFSQVRDQLARSKKRQSLGTFLNKEVLITQAEIECSICFGNIPPGDGIILHECFHTFCNECIVDLVRHSDTPEVKCPYIDANFTCTCFLSPREIKTLAPADVYESWLQKSVKLAEGAIANSVHCKTLDCPGWVEIENVENAIGAFTCVVCEKTNCLQCKAIHEGISCDDYKNRLVQNENDKKSEDALNAMVAKGECMRCPKCTTLVEKLVGCDWLMCSCCRTELCWATRGPRWGPKGKGDTSGGCGCLLYSGGKKCVPHCQNCH